MQLVKFTYPEEIQFSIQDGLLPQQIESENKQKIVLKNILLVQIFVYW